METVSFTASSGSPSLDWLGFVLGLFQATAWPISAIVIAFLFRKQIQELLARVRKGKIGPAEFEFEQGVRELVEEVAPTVPVPSPSAAEVASAVANPRAVILEVWIKLEAAVKQVAIARDVSLPRGKSSLYQVRMLNKVGILSEEDLALYNELRVLRNQAAHDEDFNPSLQSVISFVGLADLLLQRFEVALQHR